MKNQDEVFLLLSEFSVKFNEYVDKFDELDEKVLRLKEKSEVIKVLAGHIKDHELKKSAIDLKNIAKILRNISDE